MPGLFTLLRPIYIVLGSLSLLCGVLVCLAYLKSVLRPSRAAASMKPEEWQLWVFISSMSVCDAVLSLKFLLPALLDHLTESPDTVDCLLEALIGQFFAIAGVMWYAAVVMCLVMEIRGKGPKMVKMRLPAPIIVWGYSIVATAFVWFMDGFGPSADGTCWIKPERNWYRLTFFIPLWLSLMMGLFLLACALCNCNALGRRLPCYSLTRSILFVAAFIFVWIWVVVLRIYEAVARGEPPEVLILLHACGVSSQGFVNFLLWVTSPSLAAVLSAPAWKRFKCCESEPRPALQDDLITPRGLPNSLSVQVDYMYDPRLHEERPSFGAELTPRTHEELLTLDGENVDFAHNMADYRGLAD